MILRQSILNGNILTKGEIIKLIEEGDYYNKYIFENERRDKFLLYINKDYVFKNNTIIYLEGKSQPPSFQRNRGGFDYSKYMYSQGFYGSIFVENSNKIEILEENRFNIISFIQNNIFETLGKLLPKEQLGILLGMIIGDTFYITEDIENAFKLSGITHLLAVSGSNVAYIILVVKFLFNKIVGKSISNYITIGMIILFVLISGASPSVVRAGIMAIFLILSEMLAYSPNTISTVASTAVIILLYNPLIICDVGFILSFGGTLGIVFLNKPIFNWLNKKFIYLSNNNIFESILEMLSVTLSAQIILTPIMMYYFNTISFVSILTNLLVGPFTGIITVLGLIIYFTCLFCFPLGKILSYSIYILISIIIFISQICSKIPFGNLRVITPSILFIIAYYLIIFLIYSKNKVLLKLIVSILIFCQIITSIIPKDYVEVMTVDVGQGDCTLIKSQNYNILIDGGGSENSDYDVGEQVLVPYLLDNTNGVIDILFISHFHEDHAEGCISVLKSLKVNQIIIGTQPKKTELYEEILRLSKKNNIPIITVVKGDRISVEEIKFEILYPDKKLPIEDDLNNNSLVIKMSYNDISLLFTGDIESDAEKILLDDFSKGNNVEVLDIDILKVAHHGSKTSSIFEFLECSTPKIALISVGENNKFGHPHNEIIERLKNLNCEIYRTDECGEILLKIYKNKKVKVLKNINV